MLNTSIHSRQAPNKAKPTRSELSLAPGSGKDNLAGKSTLVKKTFSSCHRGKTSFDNGGIGTEKVAEVKKEDDDFEVYRKRMMLAYKFRPNPLVCPFFFYFISLVGAKDQEKCHNTFIQLDVSR